MRGISAQSQKAILSQLSAADRGALLSTVGIRTTGQSTGALTVDEMAHKLVGTPAAQGATLEQLRLVVQNRGLLLEIAAQENEAARRSAGQHFVAQAGFTAVDQRSVSGSTVLGSRLGTAASAQQQIAQLGALLETSEAVSAQRAAKGIHPNEPAPTLFKKPIDKLWQDLHSEAVLKKVEADPFLRALHTQTVCNVKHVRLDFEITTEHYVHDHVLKGPYAFEPTRGVLKQAQTFFRALDGTEPVKVSIPETPGQMQAELEHLESAHNAYVKGVIASPLATYQDFQSRLRTEGPQAKFPELKEVTRILELHMKKEAVSVQAEKNPHLAVLRQAALEELNAVQQGGHPYRKTIDAIETALGFLDVYERGKPGATASRELYHQHRYQYYTHFLKGEIPDHVAFPTTYNLGATDLLKTRGVPIGFIGVPPETTWVDGFSQSPLEFWFHDVNHTRRMWQFFSEHAAREGISVAELAERSSKYVQEEILPLLKIAKDEPDDAKNLKRMMKLVLFEIMHEDALPADKKVIAESLMRAPNTITPFEQLVNNERKVEYVMEPGATTLAYVYRKAAGNFYDMAGMRMETICGAKFRTQEFVAAAAKALATKLGLDVSASLIDVYARDDTGLPDDFRRQLELQLLEDPERMAALQANPDQPINLAAQGARSP